MNTLHERIIATVWKQWNGDLNNGVKPIWEMWKILRQSILIGEDTVNGLLGMLYFEMIGHPEQQHFSLATGGLYLTCDRCHENREAIVTLAVTCHQIGDTVHAH